MGNCLHRLARVGSIASSLAAIVLTSLPAHAVPTVWNVNIGYEIDTTDNFVGAATENTANSTWNSLGNTNLTALVDSTGAAGTVTIQLGVVGGTLGFGGNGGYLPEIFTTWCKHNLNTLPVAVTFGGLSPVGTYDLVVYGDWFWQGGLGVPITQTTGTGMSGTVTLNNFADANGTVHALTEDTDPGNNNSVRGNWIRITGLTPSGSGILGFNMNGRNAPLSGFQLIQTSAAPPDTTPPTLLSFEHDKGAGPILVNEVVTYTATFSEAMLASTVNTDDFGNTGTSAITINSVTPTVDPAVFTVVVTPTDAGTLQLQINASATLTDLANLALDAALAISDDSSLLVEDLPPTPTSITVVSSGSPTTYGQNVTFTATVDPVPSGGTVQFLDGESYIGPPVAVNTITGEASYSTSALDVATYSITAEYTGNFAFEPSTSATAASQEVGKAQLTVSAIDAIRAQNTENPALSYSITGFQNGQNLASSGVTGTPDLSTTAVLASPVGDYPITCAVGTLAADNYDFTFVDGTLTIAESTVSTVWNVNIGIEITTEDNFIGAAFENTANSFWNSVTTANPTGLALADSTGSSSAGVTLTLTGTTSYGNFAPVTGPEIFSTWIKSTDNATPYTMTIGGLNSSKTYDLIVYSDWNWKGNDYLPVTQTVGSGLTGTVTLDQISTGSNGAVPGLIEDTDPSQNGAIEGNWIRITGLTPDGSGNLGFSMGGRNAAFSGFQLLEQSSGNTFADWADANAPGQTPDQDHDKDGVENGIEYFMGETGSAFTAMPGLDETNTITWPMDAAYDGTYEIQTSPDLVNWTNVFPKPTPSGGILTYTLPPGAPSGKSFVRLLVTPTP